MNLKTGLTPKQSLNKAYLKEKVTRANIELFKKNLIEFLNGINEKESEEHVKNLVTKFLYDTYYHGKNQINTKGRIDLAIYEDKKPVVIIEAKRPNSPDMVSVKNLNAKAMHELILYYLRERIDEGNIDIKYLITTNMYEWFVFDASVFDKLFYKNTELNKDYKDWKNKRKASPTTDSFYSDIAFKFLKSLEEEIPFTWFDLRKVEKLAANNDLKDDTKLIDLFKILSPAHLLKQSFANDSNSLDTKFYSELLHIIGLEEKKVKGKKLIQRKEKPDAGSLLENAITILAAEDRLHKLPKGGADYGEKSDDRLFNVALELCITWINRILFLKLLEGQLLTYHAGAKNYRFLNFKTIPNYDELNKLFFQVLARKESERAAAIRDKFAKVPYLNSSLFDISALEDDTLRINSLDDGLKLRISGSTVLKTENGKRREGELPTLQYLFEFLDAYDFSTEGKEVIQEENKTLINASVLGLIFEKINGYKDGSFFTPGFITMYMCRETIRRAVVQKFNEAKDLKIDSFEELYNQIQDKKEANDIINSLKICDPAVGSGHFLVSALNEIIAIKSELGILVDQHGKLLRDYAIEVVNDELIVSSGHNEFYQYKPGNKESQRVQETLFHEKQTIIENCLFGVDLNPNSVKICRLRLWIELLKNAYYTSGSKFTELETLPNIDINIKQGNSLISRFPLDADLSKALRKSKWNIDTYKIAIHNYHHATSKEEKREIEKLIETIKSNFETEIANYSDPRKRKTAKLGEQLFKLTGKGRDGTGIMLFEPEVPFEKNDANTKKRKKEIEKIETEINKLVSEIDEIRTNVIYKNAFEWRFEFPEVLNNEGGFIGFDVVIGNPPYIRQEEFTPLKPYLQTQFKTYSGTADLYVFFVELAMSLLKSHGDFIFIIPNKWMRAGYGKALRRHVAKYQIIGIIDFGELPIFAEATVYPSILSIRKYVPANQFNVINIRSLQFPQGLSKYVEENQVQVLGSELDAEGWTLSNNETQILISKLKKVGKPLGVFVDGKIYRGILTGFNKAFVIDEHIKQQLISENHNSSEIIKPFLAGKDIKRYIQPTSDKYLIFTRRGININDYPSVARYLEQFRQELEPKPQNWTGSNWSGRKPGAYKWYEIQDTIDYHKEFENVKILWPGISSEITSFGIDFFGYYGNDNNQMIVTDSKYVLGILNSSVSRFFLKNTCDFVRGGFARLKISYVEKIPIPKCESKIEKELSTLVDKIIKLNSQGAGNNTHVLERQVDKLVYQLYGLTEEEIKIVEGK